MIYGNAALKDTGSQQSDAPILFRRPRSEDGHSVWELISATAALDDNSSYCNLLQCSHFASTCAVAERDGAIVGWLSGYVPPDREDTLFVWQVCVGSQARGQGVASRLIGAVLARPSSSRIRYVECTITQQNTASWRLFGSVARTLRTQLSKAEYFRKDIHFKGTHDSELAVTIGPFRREQVAALKA
ncbi:diaminobutyrate acetyltransferase [Rhizobium halophytocola]|uniref:L-2,4-diaminobutyric acid acetyltransferase n=1 Tax=Rhizobium halophytocola TaxID=735519 RepID=A0ABS4DUQ6_9HYPH|nr:diaminobutyrate acetyltransferase [Rhizobium halophytocola]MBP1849415.1 L-2,4-diaminobutyric acid acetyltransferase [Rhizobium halophytocola]